MPLGHKTRWQHECGEGKDTILSHGDRGYSAYCFRCGNIGFEAHGQRSLAELERVRELNLQAERSICNELPKDFTTDIPREHIHWLASGGISPNRAASNGIGWSDRLQRVVLPLYDASGELRYWQARAVLRGQSPKYINPSVDKTGLLYWSTPPDQAGDAGLVIVEDILSAIRVGKHLPTCTAMGTKLSLQQANAIADATTGSIRVWLDPDKAGKDGAAAMYRQLSFITDNIQIIQSDSDPKNLSDREIRDTLNLKQHNRYKYYD